jgi:D-alanyl-lipoteichoic acid acyltransferase DltB (MBOAT superfamily)
MIFNSIPFLIFFAIFFAVWFAARKSLSTKYLWICAMSFLFYGFWDWRFLFLLIGTGSIDYWCGKKLLHSTHKKWYLYISVISNLGSLLVFKYSAFFAENIDAFLSLMNIQSNFRASIPEFSLILPLGISFYTFNSLSYTIDLYKNKAKEADSWLHFMAFISFFPHLVAGPIIRAKDILGQLKNNRMANQVELWNGIKTCLWGFFQKMVLADNLAVLVNDNFNHIATQNDSLVWCLTMSAFAFQIYFDFNGYSTIARGLAKMCGIHFKLNFNHPYIASSFGDFWSRWHISLSTFFRDYVYIPLGGNRKGKLNTEKNRWITMLLSGIWHGAAFTFLFWGALHALFLSVESALKLKKHLPVMVMKIIVFTGATLAWVLFRSESLQDALLIYSKLFAFQFEIPISEILKSSAIIWLFIGMSLEWLAFPKYLKSLAKTTWVQVLFWSMLVAVTILFRGPEQQFIYFQF